MPYHRAKLPPPQAIEVQSSTDHILVLPSEILVLPDDYKGDNEEWFQDSIINKKQERIFYSKSDSQKLSKFLLEEQRSIWNKPKVKCKIHSQRCDTCEMLSRSDSQNRLNLLPGDVKSCVTFEEHAIKQCNSSIQG